jgi:hypothetical protein
LVEMDKINLKKTRYFWKHRSWIKRNKSTIQIIKQCQQKSIISVQKRAKRNSNQPLDRLPFQWFKGSTMSLMLVKFKSSYEIINDALKHGSYIDCESKNYVVSLKWIWRSFLRFLEIFLRILWFRVWILEDLF